MKHPAPTVVGAGCDAAVVALLLGRGPRASDPRHTMSEIRAQVSDLAALPIPRSKQLHQIGAVAAT